MSATLQQNGCLDWKFFPQKGVLVNFKERWCSLLIYVAGRGNRVWCDCIIESEFQNIPTMLSHFSITRSLASAHSIKWPFLGRLSFLRTLKYPHTILFSHDQQHRWATNIIVPWSSSVNLSAEKTRSPNNHFAEEIHSWKYSLNVKMN